MRKELPGPEPSPAKNQDQPLSEQPVTQVVKVKIRDSDLLCYGGVLAVQMAFFRALRKAQRAETSSGDEQVEQER